MDGVVELHPKFGYKEKGKNLNASHLAFPSKHLSQLALQKCSIYIYAKCRDDQFL